MWAKDKRTGTPGFLIKIKRLYTSLTCIFGGRVKVVGISKWKLMQIATISGSGHIIEIKSPVSKNVRIVCYGHGHHLTISENVNFKAGTLWFEDSECEIFIGKGTTIEQAHLAVAENGHKIEIGNDCMISKFVRMAVSDAHSIIDTENGNRLNPASDICIDDHVWLGYQVTVTKGVHIKNHTVVGTNSVVTKDLPANVVAAGIPAKVIKSNTTWCRERL